MLFFNWNWDGACWDCWADPLALDAALPCKKQETKRIGGARPLPLRCLSQFFPVERKDQLLRGRMFSVPFTDGLPGIYSRCFSQLDDEDSFLLDGGFSIIITIRLIRDN